ncbi:carbohydrate kinase family protein [Diaminobutyricibacter tongyongensis]|uniref:Carbohydrate kinase family protein n=1 Tax=Leifsonia tongyongensis TaxID=1268043 RepID=A0A6L9XXI9_9MICO|nr:PfkB family carbohydrate kinase [Diaminobutyricibacter tongyongensis]NEN06139.1 carbohydrate kinase family protein [Diaminobutyricibacter tongyongensis]
MSGIDVLVVGDANPDLVLTGDTVPRFGQAEQLLDSADLLLGGSAAIVACGLARLGVRTALAAVIGNDRFGALVLDRLCESGVDCSAVAVDAERPTGLSVILSGPDDRAILTLPGTIPALTADAVLEAVRRLRPRHVHFASYFLQPALAAALPGLLDELSARGVTLSLDTNWDPAERWAGVADVLRRVDVFLPNREEALAIASAVRGAPATDIDDAAALSALGCRVVVKAGAEGGLAFENGARMADAPGLVLDVVDTTGAGDSFDAGYLAAYVDGVGDEGERLRWAAVAGSLSVRGRGGTGAQATRAELTRALG